MRALAQDRTAAQLMGVEVDRYGMIGFALGAMLAGQAFANSPVAAQSVSKQSDRHQEEHMHAPFRKSATMRLIAALWVRRRLEPLLAQLEAAKKKTP